MTDEPTITNYEKYFGSPEKIASCCVCDCYMCIFPPEVPCYKRFGTSEEELLKWLKSSYIEGVK